MNQVLLLLVIAEACLGVCLWLSPGALRRLAAHMLTRGDVIEAARREQSRRLEYWQLELGLDHRASEETTSAVEAAQSVVRR